MSPEELATWEPLLLEPTRRAQAARVLAQEYRGGGQGLAPKLAVALEVLAIVTRDPREEARVLAELGRVRLSLGDAEQATLAFARALYLAPDDEALLQGLRESPDRALAADVLLDLKTDAPQAARGRIEAALADLK